MLCTGPPKLCVSPSRICTVFSCSNIILSETKKKEARHGGKSSYRVSHPWGSLYHPGPLLHLGGPERRALCFLSFQTLAVLDLSQLNKCILPPSQTGMLIKATDQCEFKTVIKVLVGRDAF